MQRAFSTDVRNSAKKPSSIQNADFGDISMKRAQVSRAWNGICQLRMAVTFRQHLFKM